MQAFLFWFFAIAAVLTAVAVVFPPIPRARDPIHSAIALVVCFFCIAATYAMLEAHLLAILQVLVYAGAIMVLFIFVIMLLNLESGEAEAPRYGFMKIVAVLLVASTAYGLVTKFTADDLLAPISQQLVASVDSPETYGTLKAVGQLMFNRYLLPFELTSILLLVAIIGAVIVAKREPQSTFISEEEKARTAQARHKRTGAPTA